MVKIAAARHTMRTINGIITLFRIELLLQFRDTAVDPEQKKGDADPDYYDDKHYLY